jgi:hypothetical protein
MVRLACKAEENQPVTRRKTLEFALKLEDLRAPMTSTMSQRLAVCAPRPGHAAICRYNPIDPGAIRYRLWEFIKTTIMRGLIAMAEKMTAEMRDKIASEVSAVLKEMKDVELEEGRPTTFDLSPKNMRYEISGTVTYKTKAAG